MNEGTSGRSMLSGITDAPLGWCAKRDGYIQRTESQIATGP